MYESTGQTVLYQKSAGAVSILRIDAKWLEDWKENPEILKEKYSRRFSLDE